MADIGRVIKMYEMLKASNRVSVRSVQDETGLSRASVYRYVAEMSRSVRVRMDDGVIVRDEKK